ncbi:MAG: ATP-binding protein [Rhodobacteraceae bacterium]|nr:ATP-binding protein [Paracoccaceae bacterium]
MADPGGRPSGGAPAGEGRRGKWAVRVAIAALAALSIATVWYTNDFLTQRFTETTRNRTELRLALYTGAMMSEIQRSSVVPLLLARDPALIEALGSRNFSITSQRLMQAAREVGAASILLMDETGRTVAATNRNLLGTNFYDKEFFVQASRSSDTVFSAARRETGGYAFTFARAIRSDGRFLGVLAVEVELARFERAWSSDSETVAILDSENTVILSTEPRWRGKPIDEAIASANGASAIGRALRATADFANRPPDAYVLGQAVMRTNARMPFQGWRIVSFSTYDSVRERVNAVLALEIMAFAVILALAFYLLSRRARSQSAAFRRESAELRQLNLRLQREIAEREKAQKDLAVAEQTLAQSSKLAALGEMSAAVSHELNQPLAAMKTYLAGAKVLLQRRRPEEALAAFQRVDDLIERMGAITRQLKSYARKGGEAFEPVDVRSCVSAALAMMEPQLRTRATRITRAMPRGPVMVNADRVRLEQVIINLLRNALDATRDRPDPQIDILLTMGETAVLTVRDNGHGIADLENLFEPFYTTKKPGDGVGLGLAISSGIVNDLGGRLTARNGQDGGAVFEIQLPLHAEKSEAAE